MSVTTLALLALLFCAGIVSSVTGGGFGTILVIVQSFFLDIRTNVAVTSVLSVVVLLAKMLQFRKMVPWSSVLWYGLAGLPCTYLGGLLLFALPPRVSEIGLGLLCFAFVAFRFAKPGVRIPPVPAALVPMGMACGFLGGLFGITGVLLLASFLLLGFRKEGLVAATAAAGVILEIGKTATYLPRVELTADLVSFLLFAVPVIFAGVAFGSGVLRKIDEKLFERLLLGVIVLGGLRFLFP